jgi:hypothetical protein
MSDETTTTKPETVDPAIEAASKAARDAADVMLRETKATLDAALAIVGDTFTAALASAPADVRAKFEGREINPIEGLKELKAELARKAELDARAQQVAQEMIEAERKRYEALGFRLPIMQVPAAQAAAPVTTPATVTPAHVDASQAGDLASVETLTADQLLTIMKNDNAMANFLAARKNAAIAAKKTQ